MFKGRVQPAGDSSPTQPRTLEEEEPSNRCEEKEPSLPHAQGPLLPYPLQSLQLVSHASFPRQAVYPPPSPRPGSLPLQGTSPRLVSNVCSRIY